MWIKGLILGSAAMSVVGSGLTAAHYASHAYARLSDRVVGAAASIAEEKMDSFAAWRGYVRPEPNFDEMDAMLVAEREALEVGMAPNLARCIVQTESRKEQFAISPKGAIGLMQIMPFNAKRCGLKDKAELLNKRKNVRCGVQIADEDIDSNKGDVTKGLQNYNGGPGCVARIEKCGNNIACMGYVSPKEKGCAESFFFAKNVLNCQAKDIR